MKNNWFWLIIILGLVLRLIGINQSMWLDEAISANVVKNYSLFEIPTKFSPSDFHPPLFYLTLKLWTNIFGNSVIVMRMLSVVLGMLTVWISYKIGQLINDKKVGSWIALFVAVNPLLVYYSQEIRMYSMITTLITGVLYFYLKLEKEKNIANTVFYNLLCLASFLTFYGSVFFIATLALIRLFKKEWNKLVVHNIGIVLAIIIIYPLLSKQMILSKEMLLEVKNWASVLGKIDLKNILLIPIKFTSGRISFYPKIWYYLVSGLWAVMVFAGIFRGAKKNKIMAIIAFLPMILGLVFSAFSPMMQYFRFLYVIPALTILLVTGTKNTRIKQFFMLGFLVFCGMYLFNENMWREDWKNLSNNLGMKVVMIESFSDPIDYYKNVEIIDVRNYDFSDEKISVVPYGEMIHGVNHKNIFEENNYKLELTENFRELVLETWVKE